MIGKILKNIYIGKPKRYSQAKSQDKHLHEPEKRTEIQSGVQGQSHRPAGIWKQTLAADSSAPMG